MMDDRRRFEREIEALEAMAATLGAHAEWEARVRAAYVTRIAQMVRDYRRAAELGEITWAQAADDAVQTRNDVLHAMRARSSPAGRAWAQALKSEPPDLNSLIARRTTELFPGKNFDALTSRERDLVFRRVVERSGVDRGRVSAALRRLRPAARGLVALSVATSVYEIAAAENKLEAAAREGSVLAAGVAGATAGAQAGLLCGPGAPVCVPLGAFVFGALAAWGMDSLW